MPDSLDSRWSSLRGWREQAVPWLLVWSVLVLGGTPEIQASQTPKSPRERRPTPQTNSKPRSNSKSTPPVQATGSTEAAQVRAFWQQYEGVSERLAERQLPRPEVLDQGRRIAALVTKAHTGLFYTEDGPTRYFAWYLQLGNETDQSVVIPREHIQAVIDGRRHPTKPIESKLVNHGFPYGGEYHPLETCQPAAEIVIPAGGVSATWLVYGYLPVQATLPDCVLEIQLPQQMLRCSVNAVQYALLAVRLETLGPHQELALLTLGGLLNTFNAYLLVEELDQLIQRGVQRFVLRWTPEAGQPESLLLHWLQNSALAVGGGRAVNDQLPTFPNDVREFHLVEARPGQFLAPEQTAKPLAPPRVHAQVVDAVAAALRSLYTVLPREELLAEIQQGHPLSQAAALLHGVSRLEDNDLPLVLRLSQQEDPAVRRAALRALGDFPHPQALDRLEQAVHGTDADDQFAAVLGFSESRYQAVRARFAAILQASEASLERRLAAVLAQQPRPEWADLLFRHVTNEQGEWQLEILRGLVQLNDPRLIDLLARVFASNNAQLQETVFQLLAERPEPRAEELAMTYVLQRLRQSPPDALLLTFLSRARDPRAVPLLLKHLEGRHDKAPLINLLGQIGDEAVGEALMRHFEQFQVHEQAAALMALRQLRHPRFLELAEKALNSPHDAIASHAIEGLVQLGGPHAERLLCQALMHSTRPAVLNHLGRAVANLGTPTARETLHKARQSDLGPRRMAALMGLQQLRQNSPGYPYWEQGLLHARAEKWDEAVSAYTLATQLDPQLAEAFAGLGDVHLKRAQYPQAEQAFAQAYRLDPANGLACSGLAIAQVMQGRLEEGLRTVEQVRGQFTEDVNYAYNVACVYGRAIEQVTKQPATPERDAQLARFRQQALADLRQAIQLKFDDWEWLQKDPDLQTLRDLPEFRQLIPQEQNR